MIDIFIFQNFEGSYEIKQSHTPDDKRPYGSILELFSVDHRYVGEYHCVHNESIQEDNYQELLTQFKANRIYVFVDGMQMSILFYFFLHDMIK